MDLTLLKSPELDKADDRSAETRNALTTMEASRAQKKFDDACRKEAAAINKIAESGKLDVMLALEYQLQLHDLTNYAKTDNEVKNTQLGLTDFMAGLTNYERLVERPEEYRRQAAGYPSASRDKKLGVPMDGMRCVLNSQLTRIQLRQSLLVSEAAKELYSARRNLLAGIRGEYSLLQQNVLRTEK